MSLTPQKRERTPILEDDDPFAARRLPKTWVSLAAGPATPTRESQEERRFSPLSPPPFSGLVPLQSTRSVSQQTYNFKEEEEERKVDTEPIVSRKINPATIRHPQFYDFSSNATSSGISDDSHLFRKAPLPPPRTPETPLTPTPRAKPVLSRKPKARFSELINHSPTISRSISSFLYLPSIKLERTSSEPLFPGSTFSFALSLPNLSVVSSPPLDALVTFSGITRSSSATLTNEHVLFRLGSTIKLTESSWKGFITIPLSSTCSTCNEKNNSLPPSFCLHDENGVELETQYSVSASCEGYEEANLEIEVSSKHARIEGYDLLVEETYEAEGFLAGWRIEANPIVSLDIVPTGESKTPTAQSNSIQVQTTFRYSSTSNASDFSTLLAAFLPEQSSAILNQWVSSTTTVPGSKVATGLAFKDRRDYFDLAVRTNNASGSQIVEVSQCRVIVADAALLAEVDSCAGFRLETSVSLSIGRTQQSQGIRYRFPIALSSPRARSLEFRSPIPLDDLPPPDTTTAQISERKEGVTVKGHDAGMDNEAGKKTETEEIAQRRWRLLRRVFLQR